MWGILILAVAVTPAEVSPITHPPCIWDLDSVTIYYPQQSSIVSPRSSAWIMFSRTHFAPNDVPPEIIDVRTSSVIEVDFEEILLPFDRSLVQVRPKTPLEVGRPYRLEIGTKGVNFSAGGPEVALPDPPVLANVLSNRGLPYEDACNAPGVVAFVEPNDAQLLLAIDRDGQVVGLSNDHRIFVKADISETPLCVRAVALDALGRRSEPSNEGCAQPYLDMNSDFDRNDSGCSATRGRADISLILLLIFAASQMFSRTVRERSSS